jgi:hypothetical protein
VEQFMPGRFIPVHVQTQEGNAIWRLGRDRLLDPALDVYLLPTSPRLAIAS